MARSATRLAAALLAALAMLLVVSQWRAIHTQNVNWDEFALLARAHDSIRTGTLVGGGRPGLAVLMLVPIVRDCASSVEAVVTARQVWLGITIAYLAGVFALVLQAARGRPYAWHGAAAAVALLALVPVFLRWSLQVRTDQPALMFATWGGVLLLASCRRLPLAMAAGTLFALAYLCTPKAAYVGALALVLLAARLTPETTPRAIEWRRGLAVLSVAAASFLAVTALYFFAVSFYDPQPVQTVQSGFNAFAYYRRLFGYRAYQAMLPTLTAHVLLVSLLAWAVFVSGTRTRPHRAALAACCAVLLLGSAVALFHAAAFPYFWMTLGVFPAVAIGVAWNALFDVFERPLARALVFAAVLLLVVHAAPAALALHQDTQRVQRDALAFVDRNFERTARGFQAEGALFCRPDPNPFRTYFADAVTSLLAGESNRPRVEAFIDEFRSRPVAFVIAHRLFSFPPAIDEFWRTHYVLYRDEVMIPGRYVGGAKGSSFEFDVIVPGLYRWVANTNASGRLAFAGMQIEGGTVFHLDRGIHGFTLLDEIHSGLLVLAANDDPSPEGPTFYDRRVIHEIDPLSLPF